MGGDRRSDSSTITVMSWTCRVVEGKEERVVEQNNNRIGIGLVGS